MVSEEMTGTLRFGFIDLRWLLGFEFRSFLSVVLILFYMMFS